MKQTSQKSKLRQRAIIVLYFTSFFEVIARNLFGPVFAAFVLHIGGDLLASGTALAINTAIVGLFIIVSGRVAHKYHTERLQLLIGYGLAALVYFGFTFVKNPHQLFVLEAISGLASAVEVPAFSGLFSELHKDGSHSKAWGDYFGVMNFVSAGALFASGAIAQHYGFNTLFLTMCAFEFCCMVTALYLFKLKAK